MTPQKAIGLVHCCMHVGHDDILQARTMAILALEKQIPKKPIKIIAERDEKIGARIIHKGTNVDKCSICNSFLSRTSKYCNNCGQALNWENP